MSLAIKEAKANAESGNAPVAAVIVQNNQVIGIGHNRKTTDQIGFAHAELIALLDAKQKLGRKPENVTLYCTLEPCAMCLGAICFTGIQKLVYGSADPLGGAVEMFNESPFYSSLMPEVITGVLSKECDSLKRLPSYGVITAPNRSSSRSVKPAYTLGAFAIIPDSTGRILLCHRTDMDVWNLPGGVVEHGESPWSAVIREVEEETGLLADVIRLQGIYSKPGKSEIVFSFVCRITGGIIQPGNEADQIEYFSPDMLPDNLLEKQRERILDMHSDTKRVFMKSQIST